MAERPVTIGDHFVLIDGSALLYRSYYGNAGLTRQSDKHPIGAVFGVVQTLWGWLHSERAFDGKPTHIAVVYDTPAKTFRHDLDARYKSHRNVVPNELTKQRDFVLKAIRAFGLQHVALDGFEADDLIASYAKQANLYGARVTVMANDKDLMQIIEPRVTLRFRPPRSTEYMTVDRAYVIEKFGVPPEQLGDLLALTGDAVDGVRGVTGIGAVVAQNLLKEYGSLDNILSNAERGPIRGLGSTRYRALMSQAENAQLARRLVELKSDVPLPLPMDSFGFDEIPYKALYEFCSLMEFPSFMSRIEERVRAYSQKTNVA